MKQLPQQHQWTNQVQLQQTNSASPAVDIMSYGVRTNESQTKLKYILTTCYIYMYMCKAN